MNLPLSGTVQNIIKNKKKKKEKKPYKQKLDLEGKAVDRFAATQQALRGNQQRHFNFSATENQRIRLKSHHHTLLCV